MARSGLKAFHIWYLGKDNRRIGFTQRAVALCSVAGVERYLQVSFVQNRVGGLCMSPWETWPALALWGTPGNWSRCWVGRSLAVDWRRRWGQMGKNGIGCLGLAAWPRRSGASEGEWDLPSSLSSTLAVQRVDRGGRRRGRVRWGLDKEV
jgi:hypothetical protein